MSFSSSLIMRSIGVISLLLILGHGYRMTFSVPYDFPVGKNFTVEEGESLRSISLRLKEEHYVRSALWFRVGVSFLGRDRHVQLGGYIFNEQLPLFGVVHKLVSGKPDVPLISVTIPEGSTTYEIAILLQKALPSFSIDIFGEKVFAAHADGRLFPSTYFLLPSTNESRAVEIMTQTFASRFSENFAASTFPGVLSTEEDIISLAAILEGEAKTKNDMHIVSGILQKRLQINMPLQVDVAPETYKKKGLPAHILNNPGLVALDAALHPTASPYLYYLTGKDGAMHYAKTFEEHKRNIQKYLK